MKDYLDNLVARTLHLGPVVQPRLASMFEPFSTEGPHASSIEGTQTAEPPETQSWLVDSQSAESAPEVSTVRPPTLGNQGFSVAVELPEKPTDHPADANHGGSVNDPLVPTNWPPQRVQSDLSPALFVPRSTYPYPDLETTETRPHAAREPLFDEAFQPHAHTDAINYSTERDSYEIQQAIEPEVRRASPAKGHTVQPTLIPPKPKSASVQNAAKELPSPSRSINHEASAPAQDTVVVTIGRVDVRAVFAPPTTPRSNRPQQPGPMSLDEYLKKRSEGRR